MAVWIEEGAIAQHGACDGHEPVGDGSQGFDMLVLSSDFVN